MSSDREPQLCLKSLWKAARLVRRHRLLIIDELGHLPIDGADMLLEIIGRRYERAPTAITTPTA